MSCCSNFFSVMLDHCGVLLGGLPGCCGSCWRKLSTAVVTRRPPGTCVRSALGKARRRSASSRHRGVGCRCAPRPGDRPAGSGTTSRPAPRSPTTTRSNSDFPARCRQPMQVRMLPP